MLDLKGKKGLIVGIANGDSLAYGIAKSCREAGAELALTYLNEKSNNYVAPLAKELEAKIYEELDVTKEGQLESLFKKIEAEWGELDFVIHSIAFCNRDDLHGRVVDASKQGFLDAMYVSAYTFVEMAKHAEPLMKNGGSLMALSYNGSNVVSPGYNVMGPVKASLESLTRYMAYELGPKGIRVNTLSPGPLKTRAGSGIKGFDQMMENAANTSPMKTLITKEDVGNYAAFLLSDGGRHVTGSNLFIDAGLNTVGV